MDNDVRVARLRFASLWAAQAARVLADYSLRMVVILQVARAGAEQRLGAWHLVNAALLVPFVLLAPLLGPLSNALPKRGTLVASAVFCLVSTAALGLLDAEATPGLWVAGFIAVMAGAAVHQTARYALLPAAARATAWPLPRLNAWVEVGAWAAMVAGLVIGIRMPGIDVALIALNLVCVAASLPVAFVGDAVRPEKTGQFVWGFLTDARRILADAPARRSMLTLAAMLALVIGGGGVVVSGAGEAATAGAAYLRHAMILVGVGAVAGALVISLERHPVRTLMSVPFACLCLLGGFAWTLLGGGLDPALVLLGLAAGLTVAPLRATYLAAIPADARGNGMALAFAANHLVGIALMVAIFGLGRLELLGRTGLLVLLTLVAVVCAAASFRLLFRHVFETLVEVLLWPIYRIYGHGPGLVETPLRGPVLLVANHTAWLDPCWLAKVYPRQLFPMMTSDFYDLPGVHWVFANVFQAIRVQASAFRREAPELVEAVDRLDAGGSVAIFPEAWLRRGPEPTLRKFGQGVWHILITRPETPVVVCWIEGGYGSFFSYFKGKPTKNKRFDFWRRIDVALSAPQVIPADVLADSRATRVYLMRACLQARGLLGLEVPPLPDMPEEEEKAEAHGAEDAPTTH